MEAGYDLGALAAVYVAIAMVVLLSWTLVRVVRALDVTIPIPFHPIRPFHSILGHLENAVTEGAQDALHALEHVADGFENGLIDQFGLLFGLFALLVQGTKAGLAYMWHSVVQPFVHSEILPHANVAQQAASDVAALARTVATDLDTAESYAAREADRAITTAHDFAVAEVDRRIESLARYLEGDAGVIERHVEAGVQRAERYASRAVETLRAAERAAVARALNVAHVAENMAAQAVDAANAYTDQAVADARGALSRAIVAARDAAITDAATALGDVARSIDRQLATIRSSIASEGAAAEATARAIANDTLAQARAAIDTLSRSTSAAVQSARAEAIAAVDALDSTLTQAIGVATSTEAQARMAADATVDQALGVVRSIAVGAETTAEDAYGKITDAGTVGLIASIPALATLVHTIATDTGLDNSECRGKVKGICGTSGPDWGKLLAGATLAAGTLSLAELLPLARDAMHALEGIVAEAA